MKKLIVLFFIFLFSCGPDPIPDPQAVFLLAPENFNNCTSASRINNVEREVTFRWTAALFAESYELIVQNTINQEIFLSSTAMLNESLILPGGSTYQWFVRSKSSLTPVTADSSSWQFYLEGDPTLSHFPFPANLITPENNTTVVLTGNTFLLEWQGNDLDNDIVFYDLYLGKNPNQLFLTQSEIELTQFSVTLESDSIYYWQIITHDKSQNQSKSSIFSFQTD